MTTLKLNRTEFKVLLALFKAYLNIDGPPSGSTMQELLNRSVLKAVFQKLHAKEYHHQLSYRFSLKEHEALAFYLFFQDLHIRSAYEANLIMQITHEIHKFFSQKLIM